VRLPIYITSFSIMNVDPLKHAYELEPNALKPNPDPNPDPNPNPIPKPSSTLTPNPNLRHAYELEKFLRVAFSHPAVAGITLGDFWDKSAERKGSGLYAEDKVRLRVRAWAPCPQGTLSSGHGVAVRVGFGFGFGFGSGLRC
jgi:hypothetical protein